MIKRALYTTASFLATMSLILTVEAQQLTAPSKEAPTKPPAKEQKDTGQPQTEALKLSFLCVSVVNERRQALAIL